MIYQKHCVLSDGTPCLIRNATRDDSEPVYNIFMATHAQTENLLSYPDENSFTMQQEGAFLQEAADSADSVELCAFIESVLVGTAGIHPVGKKDKLKHRAEFGISIDQGYWRRGIGGLLMQACLDCARRAGYQQVELTVVSTNHGALALYRKMGFIEYGRNPKGFLRRDGIWQEIVLMRLDMDVPATAH